jgi:hypothetical protein
MDNPRHAKVDAIAALDKAESIVKRAACQSRGLTAEELATVTALRSTAEPILREANEKLRARTLQDRVE